MLFSCGAPTCLELLFTDIRPLMSHGELKGKLQRDGLWDVLLFCAAFFLTAYPAGLAYRRYRMAAPFKFFAADAFYYLNVARRSQGLRFFTFDGSRPTNGFHPLWQWLLTWSFGWLNLENAAEKQLLVDYAWCALLCALGAAFLALAAARLTSSRALALFATVPGIYDLVMSRLVSSTVDNTETAPWTFINGMESGLSLLWFGLLAFMCARKKSFYDWSLTRLIVTSALLTLLTLSRLDDVFLWLAFVFTVATSKSSLPRWKRTLAISGLPVVSIGSYLVYNLRSTGFLLPVSGTLKRDPKALFLNVHHALETLVPTQQWNGPSLYAWDGGSWRTLQLVAPMVVASVFLVHRWLIVEPPAEQDTLAATDASQRTFLCVLASYVLAKGAYNLCMVRLFDQGHWYFTVSTAATNLLLAWGIKGLLQRYRAIPRTGLQPRLEPVLRLSGLLGGALLAAAAYGAPYERSLQGAALCAAAGCGFVAVYGRRLAAFIERSAEARKPLPLGPVGACAGFLFAFMSANTLVNQKSDGRYGDLMFAFWSVRSQVDAALARLAPDSRVLEIDDGIMGYSLDRATMSGTGLSIDHEAYGAWKENRCLDVAYARGFRIISSVAYWGFLNELRRNYVVPTTEADVIRALVGPNAAEAPVGAERFDFKLLYATKVGGHTLYFLEFKPKQPSLTTLG
jgi:hypothetical protein